MAVPSEPLDKPASAHRGAPGQMANVSLVVEEDSVARQLATALERSGRHRLSIFHDVAALQQSSAAPDAVVISLSQFAALRENEPMAYLRLSRKSRILVVLASRELLDAAQLLAFADAWMFADLNADLAPDLIDLGLEGHCLVPPQFLSRMGVDEIRLALLPRLTDAEFATLKFLGRGLNNRTIAEELGLSEAVVKSIVRSVLSKLHFRNRTEAGVFAARQEGALDDARAAADETGAGPEQTWHAQGAAE